MEIHNARPDAAFCILACEILSVHMNCFPESAIAEKKRWFFVSIIFG
jgi:hypothetical protein